MNNDKFKLLPVIFSMLSPGLLFYYTVSINKKKGSSRLESSSVWCLDKNKNRHNQQKSTDLAIRDS